MGKTTGPIAPGSLEESRRDLAGVSSSPVTESHEDKTDEIREDIEQTRAEMTGTIGEIQDRLSPSHLKDQVKEQVRDEIQGAKSALRAATLGKVEHMIHETGSVISETSDSIWGTIKQNPVPAALAGLGLAWLFMNRRSPPGRGPRNSNDWRSERDWRSDRGGEIGRFEAGHNGNNRFSAEGDRSGVAGEAIQKVQDRAGELAHDAQEKVGHWVDEAQFQARRVEGRFSELMDMNPVALGAVALSLGTAIGLALPRTNKENEWMGDARDNLVDKAQELASEAVDKVQRAAGQEGEQQQPGQL